MRTSILVLCVLATPGLCGGGGCALAFVDNDEFPMSAAAGGIGWICFWMVWAGVVFLESQNRRKRLAGFWSLTVAAVLSWVAFAIGIAVCREMADRYSYLSSGQLMLIWFLTFWVLGVLPTTAAARLAIKGRLWKADEQ